MGSAGKFAKILDFSILIMAITYFVGFISFHPESVFLEEAPYHIPQEFEFHFEVLLWTFFTALILDLYLKYRELNDWRIFVKKHWHDILLLALIPILSFFKIAKVSANAAKSLKAWKSGFKVVYKAKKAAKHLKRKSKKHNNH